MEAEEATKKPPESYFITSPQSVLGRTGETVEFQCQVGGSGPIGKYFSKSSLFGGTQRRFGERLNEESVRLRRI